MANPLKILANLSASAGLAVSGSDGLKVQQGGLTVSAGTSTFAGTTISDLGTVTTADINGGTIDVASIGASTQAAGKFTSISGSSTLQVAGAATLAGGVTVTGAAVNASAVEVSASALNVTNNAAVGGNLTVTGDLQVQGSLNAVNRTDLHVTDKVILVASGSANAAAANGAGLSVSIAGVDDPSFTYDQTGKWVSTENLDLASGKTFKINGTDVLSSNTLGGNVVNSSLNTVGTLNSLTVSGQTNLSGAVFVNTNTNFGLGTGMLNLTGVLAQFANSLPQSTALTVPNYYSVRKAMFGKTSGGVVRFLLSGSGDDDSSWTGANVTGGLPNGLTASSGEGADELMNRFYGASIDVAVRNGTNSTWTNDLVSINVSASLHGSTYFPLITVDAPSLADNNQIRLIVVNETARVIPE